MLALLQLHLHSRLNTWLQWIGQRQLHDDKTNIAVLEFGATYIRDSNVRLDAYSLQNALNKYLRALLDYLLNMLHAYMQSCIMMVVRWCDIQQGNTTEWP